MNYTILETHLTFKNNQLIEVAVLSKAYGDTLATISTNQPMAGYFFLTNNSVPNLDLFVKVAGYGRKLTLKEAKKYFPNHKF